jgi:ferredoxin
MRRSGGGKRSRRRTGNDALPYGLKLSSARDGVAQFFGTLSLNRTFQQGFPQPALPRRCLIFTSALAVIAAPFFKIGPGALSEPKSPEKCVKCGECMKVCPTGAIRELTIEEKIKVKIGSAWIN